MQNGFFSKRNVTILFTYTRFEKLENVIHSIVTLISKLRKRYWKFCIRNYYSTTGMMKKKLNECVQLTDGSS